MPKDSRLVYSTDQGRIKTSDSETTSNPPPSDGVIRLKRETKGRKGKGVTLVTGLELKDKELKALAKKLKQLCGTGGSIKEGVIEIQGEQRENIKAHLEKIGLTVKISGG